MGIFEHIIAFIFGMMLASYTSSVFYRLPRNIPLNGFSDHKHKPFCSLCKHPLKFYEYYSVLSWIFCGNSCNYCNGPIDVRFKITEAVVIGNSLFLHYLFGFSDNYLLFLLWSVCLTIIAAIGTTKYSSGIVDIPKILFLIAAMLGIMIKLDNHQPLMDWLFYSALAGYTLLIIYKFNKFHLDLTQLYLLVSASFIRFDYFALIAGIIILLNSISGWFKLQNPRFKPSITMISIILIYLGFLTEIYH